MGGRVSWASDGPTPAWLNVCRDFTERWVHQQQIRDAVNREGLKEADWLSSVLRTFIWCLPHHYRHIKAPIGNLLGVNIEGPGGGQWTLQAGTDGWELSEGGRKQTTASVRISSELAWRLFTGALPEPKMVHRSGDERLSAHFLTARSIIV
jgi:hypothetical protein